MGQINQILQLNGKIIVGGRFTSFHGQAVSHLTRLNSDGTIDSTFSASANTNVYAIALQADGRVLIGGEFSTVNGVPRTRIARLLGDSPLLSPRRADQGHLAITWPAAYTNWVLEATKQMKFANWETVTNTPVTVNGMNYVTNSIGQSGKFYRLVKQ